jgi:oxygen-independent coproporphyrinogen-3 oxidase
MNERYSYSNKDNEFIAWYPLGLTTAHSQNVWQRKRSGYYVHIPFCTAICDYCGFAVEKLKGGGVRRYLSALRSEIERYARSGRLSNYDFVCGHFGGGTPSAIDAGDLMAVKALIDESFNVQADAEITVEVNPISFTLEKARAYKSAGVNRISFGVQSFNDTMLATIGRPHRAKDVHETLSVIHEVGWDNYSIDLIYGIPGQTLEDLREDLARAVEIAPAHISSFRLEIIPLTVLKLREAAHLLPDRIPISLLNEMDDLVSTMLTKSGYVGYGAFNFARPGFESVHNSVAFMAPQGEYVGFGNSAYSFINGYIYCNHADLDSYEEAVSAGQDPIALATPVNTLELMSRFFVLGLKFFRVSRVHFERQFGIQAEQIFGDLLSELNAEGLLVVDGDDYVLTPKGRRYVNNVVKEFFVGENRGRRQYHQFVSNLTMEQIMRFSELRAQATGQTTR